MTSFFKSTQGVHDINILMVVVIIVNKKNSLKNFLWLISLPGVLHVDKVRVVFAFLVVGERGVVADPIVSHLDSEGEKKHWIR